MTMTAATLFGFNGAVSKVVLSSGLGSLRLSEIRSTGAAIGLLFGLAVLAPARLAFAATSGASPRFRRARADVRAALLLPLRSTRSRGSPGWSRSGRGCRSTGSGSPSPPPTRSPSPSTSLLGRLDTWQLPLWAPVLSVIVMGTIIPFALVVSALRQLPATRVGIVAMLEPVAAGIVAWAWLGESLNAAQLAGSCVVLVGIVLALTAR
jgi:hypothetical protein